MTEDEKLIASHREKMISNLRMANDADAIMAFDSARQFLSEAADHAAIATELRAMVAEAGA